jgi:hypothetical protein
LPLIPNGLVRALAAPAENTRNGPHRKTFIIADFSCMLHQGPLRAAIAFDTLNPQSRLFAASKVRKQPFSFQTPCPFIVSKPLGLGRANMQPRKTVR